MFSDLVQGIGGTLMVALLLVGQGYFLSGLLFGARRLEAIERIAFSIGLSAIMAAATGLALHVLAIAITPRAWVLATGAVCCVTVVASRGARRGATIVPPRLGTLLSSRDWGLLGGAAALVVAVLWLSMSGALMPSDESFTQFWALASEGRTLDIGVESREAAAMSYEVVIRVGEAEVREAVRLEPRGTWEGRLDLSGQPEVQGVTAVLYREGESTPYRRLAITLPPPIAP